MEDSNETHEQQEPEQGKRFPMSIVAVAIATGVAVWLVPDDESSLPEKPTKTTIALPTPKVRPDSPEESTTETRAEVPPSMAAEIPPIKVPAAPPLEATDTSPVAETETQPPIETDMRPGEYARTFIAGLRNDTGDAGSKAFSEAQRQRDAGQPEDAYILFFFAAKQGHEEAAFILGTQSDPAYFAPDNGIYDHADPAQAYKWYQTAADNGNAEAEQRMAALLERIEQQAATGDQNARRLMLQWR